jgi:hypothetical protein
MENVGKSKKAKACPKAARASLAKKENQEPPNTPPTIPRPTEEPPDLFPPTIRRQLPTTRTVHKYQFQDMNSDILKWAIATIMDGWTAAK